MAMHDKSAAAARIRELGLVPLFYHSDPGLCRSVGDAVFASGCDCLEFTNRGEGALSSFAALIERARGHPKALVGAGSINDAETAGRFLDLGADFIVGPGFSRSVARLCNRKQVLYMPGCATVTEVLVASQKGAPLIKIFPADSLGGPAFIKALRGPLPWLQAVATGGVKATPESLREWFKSGVAAVGLGSDLIGKDVLENRGFSGLERRLKELLAVVRDIRGGNA
jgi:2-dehydro-3-deoxyphosphogluconate aldolase / (4S)-4-hydroxy-2-oxoglutarate aldolase